MKKTDVTQTTEFDQCWFQTKMNKEKRKFAIVTADGHKMAAVYVNDDDYDYDHEKDPLTDIVDSSWNGLFRFDPLNGFRLWGDNYRSGWAYKKVTDDEAESLFNRAIEITEEAMNKPFDVTIDTLG